MKKATAKWVLEMRLGKPRQQLGHDIETPKQAPILKVVYEGVDRKRGDDRD